SPRVGRRRGRWERPGARRWACLQGMSVHLRGRTPEADGVGAPWANGAPVPVPTGVRARQWWVTPSRATGRRERLPDGCTARGTDPALAHPADLRAREARRARGHPGRDALAAPAAADNARLGRLGAARDGDRPGARAV